METQENKAIQRREKIHKIIRWIFYINGSAMIIPMFAYLLALLVQYPFSVTIVYLLDTYGSDYLMVLGLFGMCLLPFALKKREETFKGALKSYFGDMPKLLKIAVISLLVASGAQCVFFSFIEFTVEGVLVVLITSIVGGIILVKVVEDKLPESKLGKITIGDMMDRMKRIATWLFSNEQKQRITGNLTIAMLCIIGIIQILWFSGIATEFFNSTPGLIITSATALIGFIAPYVIAIKHMNRVPKSPNYEWVFLTISNMLSAGTGMSLIAKAFGTLTLLMALTIVGSSALVVLEIRERWKKMKIAREKDPIGHMKRIATWLSVLIK